MKFPVLLFSTLIVRCMTGKSRDTETFMDEAASNTCWTCSLKRFSMALFILSSLVLYYVPESRSYVRKGCHLMIDLIASGLKSSLPGTDSFCDDIRPSYSAGRFERVPGMQHSFGLDDTPKDFTGDPQVRRRHRVKQDAKNDEDSTGRRHVKKKHRHNERSKHIHSECRHVDDELSRAHSKSTSKDTNQRISSLIVDPQKIDQRCYYPRVQRDDDSPIYAADDSNYSASFTTSNIKSSITAMRMDGKYQDSIITLHEDYRRTAKNRRKLYLEDDVSPKHCESFIQIPLNGHEGGYNETRESDYSHREFDAFGPRTYSRHEDSATTIHCRDDGETWEGDQAILHKRQATGRNDLDRRSEGDETSVQRNVKRTGDSTLNDGDRTDIVSETASRKVDLRRGKRDNSPNNATEGDDEASSTKSEEVLGQIADQIARLDRTVRTMRPRSRRNVQNCDDGKLHTAESIEIMLKDIKRGFDKITERAKKRQEMNDARNPKKRNHHEEIKPSRVEVPKLELTEQNCYKRTGSHLKHEREVPENRKRKTPYRRDPTLFSDDGQGFLYPEEYTPMPKSRVKPVLFRAMDWLFSSCPNSSVKSRDVGTEGNDHLVT